MSTPGPDAVPGDLYRQNFLPDLLIAALERSGDRPALHIDGVVHSASQLRSAISQFTQAFGAVGIEQGDGVATLSKNRPEVLCSMGAVMLSGAATRRCTRSARWTTTPTCSRTRASRRSSTTPASSSGPVSSERGPGAEAPALLGEADVGEDLLALAATFEEAPLVAPLVDAEDLSGLAYTGGTTGKPKGVMGTYRRRRRDDPDQGGRVAVARGGALPHLHAAQPRRRRVLRARRCCGRIAGRPPGLRAGAVLEAIESHRITATMLVPTMIYVLLDHPKFDRRPVEPGDGVLRRFADVADPAGGGDRAARARSSSSSTARPSAPHGRHACCARRSTTSTTWRAWRRAAGRCPGCTWRCSTTTANEVPPGEPGEICVRGPLVMKGYSEQAGADRGGARARLAAHRRRRPRGRGGLPHIVDRKKDMIITGGFNVFPREVEDVIAAHPCVAAVAVIGVPDERWGEAVKAVVVRAPGQTVDADELIALVQGAQGRRSRRRSRSTSSTRSR